VRKSSKVDEKGSGSLHDAKASAHSLEHSGKEKTVDSVFKCGTKGQAEGVRVQEGQGGGISAGQNAFFYGGKRRGSLTQSATDLGREDQ